MSTADHDSSLELRITPPVAAVRDGGSPDAKQTPSAGTEIWLDGGVLACRCPDCEAPMSIRLWLCVADCWRCGASIELSHEQQRVAERLMRDRTAGPAAPVRATPPAPATAAQAPPPVETTPMSAPAPRPRRDLPPRPGARPTRRRLASVALASSRMRKAASLGTAAAWVRGALTDLPAWLVSMIIHMIALILLALWTMGGDPQDPHLTLSTAISPTIKQGARTEVQETGEVAFDLPVAKPRNAKQRQATIRANQDQLELRLEPDVPHRLPDLQVVKASLANKGSVHYTMASRDPRLRPELIKREGGTIWTEAAVARGLRWLAAHQNADGSWSLGGFAKTPGCQGRCSGHGRIGGKVVGTSLALLPFLGAGQAPDRPCKYRQVVARGLRWLIAHQQPNGDLAADVSSHGKMYVHGQAAIVLCEAFGMTANERFRDPAQRAIDFIVEAQHPRGGWRYMPGQEGDTSVLGWQLMALHSGKSATLSVPDPTLSLADQFLDSVIIEKDRFLYGYLPGRDHGRKHVMTAEALLCRFYLGWRKDDPGMSEAIDWLLENHPPDPGKPNLYYWYYATQVMRHWGGRPWKVWNDRMQQTLVRMQRTEGHEAGSWTTGDQFDSTGGRLYVTSLAVCTLEVYYRYAPVFRQIELD